MKEHKLDNLSLRLKFAMKMLHVSQTDLAKKISVKPQVIQYLCASESQKSKFTGEIAEALNIDLIWLATGKGQMPSLKNQIKNENTIPLLSYEQLKELKINKKSLETKLISHWITLDYAFDTELFAVQINDRAMAPRFDLKTIVIIEPLKREKIVSHLFLLVYLADEDFIVFRQFVLEKDQQKLVAINKNLYKDVLLNQNDIVLGVCKEARWSF